MKATQSPHLTAQEGSRRAQNDVNICHGLHNHKMNSIWRLWVNMLDSTIVKTIIGRMVSVPRVEVVVFLKRTEIVHEQFLNFTEFKYLSLSRDFLF